VKGGGSVARVIANRGGAKGLRLTGEQDGKKIGGNVNCRGGRATGNFRRRKTTDSVIEQTC